jgi:hypothetical protein
MKQSVVRERLQALPPDLPDTLGRFELVRDRVRRRRRLQAAGAAAALALVVVASPVVARLATSADDDRGVRPSDELSASPEPVPGGDHVTSLGDSRVHAGAGTETVELGARPAGATSVSTELTCVTAGRITWPDGASISCSTADVPSSSQSVVELVPGQHDVVIRAGAEVSWRIRTTYVSVETTAWGVNAHGDTYGVSNDRGDPDLLSVVATNGRIGYVYADELDHASGGDVASPQEALEWQEAHGDETISIPAYQSDGETVIGEFTVGGGHDGATEN